MSLKKSVTCYFVTYSRQKSAVRTNAKCAATAAVEMHVARRNVRRSAMSAARTSVTRNTREGAPQGKAP